MNRKTDATHDPRTRAVRAGLESDPTTGAVVPPIHLSSTFAFPSFGVKGRYDYSRSGNPTRDILAEAVAPPQAGLGSYMQSLFADCSLEEPIAELKGDAVRPVSFD